MKNFCWRAGEPPRPLQTCSLRRLFATFRLAVQTRKSGLCAARTGRGQKCQNQYDFVTFGGFGDFCRPTACQNLGRTPFAPRLFPRQSEPKRKRLVRLERTRNLRSAEDARVGAPAPYFSYGLDGKRPKFGKFSALARDRREISQNFGRNRHQRPEFALERGFGRKVFPKALSRLFEPPPPHRPRKAPDQDPGKSGRK